MSYLFLLIPIAGMAAIVLLNHLENRKPTYIATATVVSHRMGPAKYASKYASGWNYYVTFRLSDGDEIELSLGEAEYHALDKGMTGILHWQNTDFREFETND